MAKIHNITALLSAIFGIVMLVIIFFPMDVANKNIEDIYHANEGKIWLVGIVIGIAIAVRTFINGVVQSELKTLYLAIKEKDILINTQNIEIIKNQKEYITEIRLLNGMINKNNKNDIETLAIINELRESVDTLHDRVEKSESKIKENVDAIADLKKV